MTLCGATLFAYTPSMEPSLRCVRLVFLRFSVMQSNQRDHRSLFEGP